MTPDQLPKERIASLKWYEQIQIAATAQGQQRWREAEAFLGRHDLFYLLVRLLRRTDANKDWLFDRCREVQTKPDGRLDLWAREHYKDLAIDTPVFTANRGWTGHGDLVPGDMVFAPDGREVAVIGVTEHFQDSKCYLVTFSDDARVVAGAGHLWKLRRKAKLRVPNTWREGDFRQIAFIDEIATTEQMAQRRGRLDVGVCAPLQYSEAALPIDPYVLGVWLGDGETAGARITASFDDAPAMAGQLATCGALVKETVHSNAVTLALGGGMRVALRDLGVLGNKHIPEAYMRASVDQRMALLQGLMDTDGHCEVRGTATFVQAKQRLSEQVYELAASLGLRPRIRRYVGKYKEGNIFWQVSFQAHADRNPFRTPRKAAIARPRSHYRGVRTVAKIEPTPSVPTNCIQVEGGMYCVGREMVPTHNSTIITFALTVQDILKDPETTCGIFSHTRPIAKGFLSQIKREFEDNEWLKAVYPDVLWSNPQKEAPRWSEDGGLIVKRAGNPKEATVEAHGLVDGQPTGKHFSLRVYDDVVTRESVSSPDMVQKTTDAWDMSQNLGSAGGRVRTIGTRYSLYDSYASMLDRGAVIPRIYAATHNGRLDGRPVFLSEEYWGEKLRNSSRAILASQQMQNPMADSDATFQMQWLRPFEVRPRTLNVYIMGDPSRGRTSTSDNCAIAVIGIAAGGTKFLLDGACHRMTLSQRWQALRTLYHRWSATRGVQHVAVGWERFGAQSDDEYFQEQMDLEARRRIPNAYFPISELSWPREGGHSKKERIERLEPDFRNGRFFLPAPVLRDGKQSTWNVEDDPDSKHFGVIEYSEATGLSRQQMNAIEGGSSDLVAKALICRDPNAPGPGAGGGRYDLTVTLIGELQTFPYGRHDDLLDSVSRIYDMDPHPPSAPSSRVEVVNTYSDGV